MATDLDRLALQNNFLAKGISVNFICYSCQQRNDLTPRETKNLEKHLRVLVNCHACLKLNALRIETLHGESLPGRRGAS